MGNRKSTAKKRRVQKVNRESVGIVAEQVEKLKELFPEAAGEGKFLNLTRDALFACRDVALDDETAANLALQCKLRTI